MARPSPATGRPVKWVHDPRWVLAGIVVAVWSALTLIDAFSVPYEMPEAVHIGAGGLLGVLLGSAIVSGKDKGGE